MYTHAILRITANAEPAAIPATTASDSVSGLFGDSEILALDDAPGIAVALTVQLVLRLMLEAVNNDVGETNALLLGVCTGVFVCGWPLKLAILIVKVDAYLQLSETQPALGSRELKVGAFKSMTVSASPGRAV